MLSDEYTREADESEMVSKTKALMLSVYETVQRLGCTIRCRCDKHQVYVQIATPCGVFRDYDTLANTDKWLKEKFPIKRMF